MFIKIPAINPTVWDKPKLLWPGAPRKFERPLSRFKRDPHFREARPVLAPVSRTLILIMLIYQTRIGLMRVNFFSDIFKERVGMNC
jgi:hypothetical protein